ncbi:hypothetical protein [Gordonia araii]|nr:hypothetical protein [Gordonia araii]NNG97112.1 hypothetical protein [Gordonia araii NBRC 100433]
MESARLAVDCHRVADSIDEHVALLRSGAYGSVRTQGSTTGYHRAVESVASRLAQRATELRAAARGLTARSGEIAEADDAAAQRIVRLDRGRWR